MNRKWIVGAFLGGLMTLSLSTGEAVNISYQEYQMNDRVVITVPLIFDMKNKETEASINEYFLESAKKTLNSIANKEELLKLERFEFISDYEVHYNEEDFLSILQKYYVYYGGAHGNTHYVPYNLDMKTERRVTLPDLFKEGADITALLTPLVQEELVASGQSKRVFDLSQVSVEKDTIFYMTHTGLVILYSPYEIAPYSEGTIRIHIPWWKVEDQRK